MRRPVHQLCMLDHMECETLDDGDVVEMSGRIAIIMVECQSFLSTVTTLPMISA